MYGDCARSRCHSRRIAEACGFAAVTATQDRAGRFFAGEPCGAQGGGGAWTRNAPEATANPRSTRPRRPMASGFGYLEGRRGCAQIKKMSLTI